MADPVGHITLPLYKIGDREFTNLHQGMMDAGPHSVSTSAGLGSDQIYACLEVDQDKHDYYYVLGRDLLAATLYQTKHPDARRIPTSDGFKVSRD